MAGCVVVTGLVWVGLVLSISLCAGYACGDRWRRRTDAMRSPKAYLLWGLGVAGVGLVLGLCASGGLVLALKGLVPMPPWLWVLARCLVVVQG